MSQNWTPPPSPAGGAATIPNYLVPAIISIFCCWPLAIPAIIFATQVNGKVAAGDNPGALEASAKAKKFMKLAFIIGSICWVLFILIYVVIFGAALLAGSTSNSNF
jgi:hypothetical protein